MASQFAFRWQFAMARCGRFGTNMLVLSKRQRDNALCVCDAISEEADLILAVSEEEEEEEEGGVEPGGGRKDTLTPYPPTAVLSEG